MIDLKAYKEWKEIFDENVANVWEKESIPVLKKLSMMLFSIKKEIKNIQAEVDKDVSELRESVIEAQNKQKVTFELKSSSRGSSNNNNNEKENTKYKKSETKVFQPKNCSQNISTVDSPEMFQNVEVPLSSANDSGSIIISDEDMPSTLTSVSPEIKRKKRNHASQKRSWREKKSRDSNTPTMTFFRELIGNCKEDSNFKQGGEKRERGNSIDNLPSMDFLRFSNSQNKPLDEAEGIGKEGTNVTSDQKENNDLKSKIGNMVLTPVRNDCDIDLSVVQCTPISILLPKRKDKTSSYLSKKRMRKEKSSTLTQMFRTNKTKIANEKKDFRLQEANYDSDESHYDPASGKSSATGSLMGITRMVSYLNTNSPLKEKNDAEKTKRPQKAVNLDLSAEEIADIVKDIGYEDFEDADEDEANNTLNSAIVEEENENETTGVSKGLNEFLAKAQKVPDYQLEAEPVVRGKERQKLPGWSCKDCEKFYLKQGLNPNQMLALNQKCSKHRGYFRPREDTLPGYWDMAMNTPTQTEN